MIEKKQSHLLQFFQNRPVTAIIAVAFVVRLLIVFFYQHITIYPDTEDYVMLAQRLAHFDLSGYEGQRSPGYPLLLILTAGYNPVAVLLQSLLGIATLVVTYKTLLLLNIGNKVSLITTMLLACYVPIVFFELAILTETLTLFVVASIFYQFFKIRAGGGVGWSPYLLLSVLCGCLVLIKPFYIFLAFLLFGFLVLNKTSLKLLVRYSFVLLVPCFVFFGWSYVNKVNTGYFVSTTFYGFNLSQNCVSFAENTTGEYKDIGLIYARYRDRNIAQGIGTAMSIWDAYPELEEKTRLSFPDLSDKLYNYSKTTIAHNRWGYAKQVFVSWRDFWKTSLYYEYDRFAVAYSNGIIKYISLAERIVLQLVKLLFVLLLPYQLYIAVRRRRISPSFIISAVVFSASILQAIVTYGTNSRFSFPFEMLIVISVLLNAREYYAKRLSKN